MPIRHDTSFCRFCTSPLNWTCTSASTVTMRWLLDANGPLPTPTLLLLGRRGLSIWSLPISVTIGPPIQHSITIGYCFVAWFSLRTGPNMCLLVSTPLATIYHLWNLRSFGEAVGPKPLSSEMNRWTLSQAFPRYLDVICSGESSAGFAGARAVYFGWT